MATQAPNKPPVSPLTQESFCRYVLETLRVQAYSFNMRSRMQAIDRIYQRETDYTETQRRAQAANASGDASRMQNVTLPVVMPQVESLLSELSEIFLSSYPLFPVISRPDMQDAALQLETIIGEHGVEFGWAAEILQSLRDALKYNLMATEVDWEVKKVYTVTSDATQNIKHGSPTETVFQGNKLKRLDPYNLILDTRVQPYEVHTKGEYAGYTELISRTLLKMRIAELDATKTMNAKEAFESGEAGYTTAFGSDAYFVPQVNPLALVETTNNMAGSINWHAWAGLESNSPINYSNMYEYTVLYARIIPSEHRITGPAANTPQVWKIIIINRKVVIYAERMSNAHNMLPIIVAQATEDGLGWQSKSFADNAAPFQALASALYNSGIESQRRKVYDRIFYDPSRVNKKDIENTSTVARIAVKDAAYGKPISDSVYAMPYRDDNVAQIFSVADQIFNMADIVNGQNKVQRGQFQKGNKTRHEFQDVMDNSNARPRMTALVLEARYFTPIKTILKLNTLQYQPPVTLYNRNTKQAVKIDPTKLRAAALEFRLADGMMPVNMLLNLDLFKAILQIAGQYPPIVQNWDLPGMIFYWLKLEGATWIDDFKIEAPQQPQIPQPPTQGQP